MSDKPLFQDSDEQERTYAPNEVPGSHAREVNKATSDIPDDPALLPHDHVSGVPLVPTRGDLSQPYPIAAPAVTDTVHDEERHDD